MSNTIYLLGIIAWVIYNFYKAGKKVTDSRKTNPKKSASPSVPYDNEEKEFGSILEEILSKKEVNSPKPVVLQNRPSKQTSSEEIFDETAFDTETIYNKESDKKNEQFAFADFTKQYDKISDTHSVHNDSPFIEEKEEDRERNWLGDMDIAKAVVYAEILKRPVY